MEEIKVCICKGCGEEKPVTDFWNDKNKKNGLRGKCKSCLKKEMVKGRKKYYQTHKEKLIEKAKKRYSIKNENKIKREYKKRATLIRDFLKCNKCNLLKPLDEFNKGAYECKECRKKRYRIRKKEIAEKQKKYYAEHKEQVKESMKKWRSKNYEDAEMRRQTRELDEFIFNREDNELDA